MPHGINSGTNQRTCGGKVVVAGTPEQVVAKESHTGGGLHRQTSQRQLNPPAAQTPQEAGIAGLLLALSLFHASPTVDITTSTR